jgi:ATP-dependent protease HslVU (ClpYQ) peptidase subunit
MTTIAYDTKLGVVAADSQETWENGQKYNCPKLYQVDGKIIATAGGSYAGLLFVDWFSQWEGEPDWDDHPDLINLDLEEDFECLVIREDGSCFTVNRLFVPYEQVGNQFITLGSGGAAARGALMAGATPKEAVEIAKKIDAYTGGKVRVLSHD